MILNAISATRTPEDRNLPFADDLWIWPIPKGPRGASVYQHVMGCWWIWKFAQNQAAAKKFLADLEINYKDAFLGVEVLQLPELPGGVSVQADPEGGRAGHAQAAGQVRRPHDDRAEVHGQPGTSRLHECGVRRDVRQVPDPEDVRARSRRRR